MVKYNDEPSPLVDWYVNGTHISTDDDEFEKDAQYDTHTDRVTSYDSEGNLVYDSDAPEAETPTKNRNYGADPSGDFDTYLGYYRNIAIYIKQNWEIDQDFTNNAWRYKEKNKGDHIGAIPKSPWQLVVLRFKGTQQQNLAVGMLPFNFAEGNQYTMNDRVWWVIKMHVAFWETIDDRIKDRISEAERKNGKVDKKYNFRKLERKEINALNPWMTTDPFRSIKQLGGDPKDAPIGIKYPNPFKSKEPENLPSNIERDDWWKGPYHTKVKMNPLENKGSKKKSKKLDLFDAFKPKRRR